MNDLPVLVQKSWPRLVFIRVVKRQRRSPGGNYHLIATKVKDFQKVKVTRSKSMVPCRRSYHMEYTFIFVHVQYEI